MSVQWISPSRIEYLLQEDFTGIDITSVDRIENAMQNRTFVKRVFSDKKQK